MGNQHGKSVTRMFLYTADTRYTEGQNLIHYRLIFDQSVAINAFLGRTDDESFLRCLSGHKVRRTMKFEFEIRRATQNVFVWLENSAFLVFLVWV